MPRPAALTKTRLRAAVIALAVATASCSGSTPAVPAGPAARVDGALDLVDFAFHSDITEIGAGRQVTMRVTNKGSVPHNVTIPAIEASFDYEPGDSSNLIFIAPAEAGLLEIFCTYFRDRGMTGTLVVQG